MLAVVLGGVEGSKWFLGIVWRDKRRLGIGRLGYEGEGVRCDIVKRSIVDGCFGSVTR